MGASSEVPGEIGRRHHQGHSTKWIVGWLLPGGMGIFLRLWMKWNDTMENVHFLWSCRHIAWSLWIDPSSRKSRVVQKNNAGLSWPIIITYQNLAIERCTCTVMVLYIISSQPYSITSTPGVCPSSSQPSYWPSKIPALHVCARTHSTHGLCWESPKYGSWFPYQN